MDGGAPGNPGCHAGMSFTALRDAAPFAPGPSSWRFFSERFEELARAGAELAAAGNPRTTQAAGMLAVLSSRASRARSGFAASPAAMVAVAAPVPTAPPAAVADGIESIEGEHLTLLYEGKRCIHARFCVTGAPAVFLANVKGPWIFPDAMPVERLVDIAHACPSGAIRYRRKDGAADETAPPVNLAAIREAGPYAVHGDVRLDGQPLGFRMTLCRCGASKNKPFCDSSHHDAGFHATGEPETGVADTSTAMLDVRNGPLSIDPEPDGPLQVRGNLEITSGTGRVVSRVQQARLCRCGASGSKPFCDGSYARVGFRST